MVKYVCIYLQGKKKRRKRDKQQDSTTGTSMVIFIYLHKIYPGKFHRLQQPGAMSGQS